MPAASASCWRPAPSSRRPTERPEGELSDDQWRAVSQAHEHRLSILTGGPGTGKTFAMRSLVEVLRGAGRRVRLCAPTGKAARRLAESTGHDATTIHRLLEWSGEDGGFTRDASDPIPGADLLVVDEASMLSLRLADALFQAVGPRTHVLLVGDADQLPPVGAGRVLDDLLDSDAVPAVRLTEIFRQAARSLIVRAAHAINHGELPPTRPDDEDGLRDFFLVARDASAELFAEAISLATARLPAHYGLDPVGDIQMLSPMHRGTGRHRGSQHRAAGPPESPGRADRGHAAARRRPRRAVGQRPRARADERRDRRAGELRP